MNHALGAHIVVVPGIPICMEYAGEILEDRFGHLARARHLKIEHHTFTRRTVLPEVGFVVLALSLWRLHPAVGFVGLNIAAGQKIAQHHIDHRNQ